MIELTGDLFSTTLPVTGHGVNSTGVMGAGVAKVIRDKYPKNYKEYKQFCESAGRPDPGIVYYVHENGRVIMNMFTQKVPGPYAQYHWVLESAILSLELLKNQLPDFGTRIAIPRIGSGIGGLDWEIVKDVLLVAEKAVPGYEFVVYTLEVN